MILNRWTETSVKIQTVATHGGTGGDQVESDSKQIQFQPLIKANMTLRMHREM